MEINLKEAGDRIKSIRKHHNYSMALFSNLIGNSSASTVNNWEKGNNLPKADRLEKIAILGNTTADWIRYGAFTEYVQKLLKEANLRRNLDETQFRELVQVLKNQKITYSQDLKILTTANKLFPDLFETSYQSQVSEQNTLLIAEDSTTYRIERNDRYRSDFLPMIEGLLHDSSQREINASVIFLIFDLLKHTEKSENFLTVSQIFTMLSDILTNNIAYRDTLSPKVRYDDNSLSEQTLKKKYEQTKKELILLLDAFYSEYNES